MKASKVSPVAPAPVLTPASAAPVLADPTPAAPEWDFKALILEARAAQITRNKRDTAVNSRAYAAAIDALDAACTATKPSLATVHVNGQPGMSAHVWLGIITKTSPTRAAMLKSLDAYLKD